MIYPAIFMDGETARRHEVSLSFSHEFVVISNDQENCLSTWDVAQIATRERITPGKDFLLSCSTKGGQRLRIEDERTKRYLFNIIPDLTRRHEHIKENRLAVWLSACVVAASLLGYIGLPLITENLVHLIPQSYEDEMFQGAGVTIAKQFGAKQACVTPESQEVLNQMLVRLIGEEKAASISVTVVDHKMVNAFATPGRQILIMRGLIDEAKGPDEVIGVLAHELGHVEERHPMQATLREAGLTFVLSLFLGGDWVDFTSYLAETSYSRDNERDSDRFALMVLGNANIRTSGLADFFERLDKENHTLEKVLQVISTHPMSAERAEMIRGQVGGEVSMSTMQWVKLKHICKKRKNF